MPGDRSHVLADHPCRGSGGHSRPPFRPSPPGLLQPPRQPSSTSPPFSTPAHRGRECSSLSLPHGNFLPAPAALLLVSTTQTC
uniref:Uncharacterized protein n=1 Tax=Oryza rufipogon TaxID=4529 RepID=A0A0E0R1D1_ORYRU